jgi:hypothetical protein
VNLPCMAPMGVRFAPTMTMLSAILLLLMSQNWKRPTGASSVTASVKRSPRTAPAR